MARGRHARIQGMICWHGANPYCEPLNFREWPVFGVCVDLQSRGSADMMGHSKSHLLHPPFMQLLSQYFEIFGIVVQLCSCLFFVGSMKCSYFAPSAAPSFPWGRLGVVVPSLCCVVVPTLRYNWDYLMAGAYWLKLSILDLTQVGFGTKVARASAQKNIWVSIRSTPPIYPPK